MIGRIYNYMGKWKAYGWAAVACVMAEAICELLVPMVMADMVDYGVVRGDIAYILQKGAVMLVFALCALVLGVASAWFSARAGQGLGAQLRQEQYQKLQAFSFSNIDRFRVPSLITRMTGDIANIQNTFSSGIRPAVRGPVMIVVATGVAFHINGKLAFVFFVALPILAVLLFSIIVRVRPLYSKMQTAIDLVNRVIRENLAAIRVVKAYVRGEYEQEKFEQGNHELLTRSEKAFRLSALNMPALQLVMYATILGILWFGGNLIQSGQMQIGELTSFLSYVLQILNSLMMISSVFMMLSRSVASAVRVCEVLDETPDIQDPQTSEQRVLHGEVEFRGVWFKYESRAQEYVLKDVNLHIPAGQTVGIIGQTGSSKSTLVQLIPRLYEATKGDVFVDGVSVKEYSQAHLRDAIGMVLQKNLLFTGTVRENLQWGCENATDEEILWACRIAGVDEFLDRLPKGLDTFLDQGGVNVSGGQKQRLCIARALLKRPKILILDDSTSAVDTMTEAVIQRRMQEELPDMTKIIIAQRVSSVQKADQIVVMADGVVDAVGTHEQLLAHCEVYREICESQKQGGLEQ